MRTAALIVAAGRGSRAGSELPKQYLPLHGTTVLTQTLSVFLSHPSIALVQTVIHAGDQGVYSRSADAARALPSASGALLPPVPGGDTRQASVLAGLLALAPHQPDIVLIHDAARPFVSRDEISRVIAALETHDGALPGLEVADTLKRAGDNHRVAETVPRAGLWRAQTPQGFRYPAILAAHNAAKDAGLGDFTDDAAIAEWAGLAVLLVPGNPANIKLTTAEDIAQAQRSTDPAMTQGFEPRSGTGFDVHRFTDGSSVWLCGVEIPHNRKLEGHSDADVGLHALTDALLGAIGDGDIGQHFPPSDPKWKGASSDQFLADAAARVRARGARIANVDVTLLCEEPRIGPHRSAMQARIAEILGIEPSRVGVKATTTEGLGFTGRREGIAAMASALVLIPFLG